MSSVEKPLVYLILGASDSGRREVLVDLIEGGLEEVDRAAVLVSENERPAESEAKLPAVARWAWRDDMIVGTLPVEATRVFFVTDGQINPIEQIEVFKAWVEAQGGELARIISVVNCQLAARHPPLLAWYEACVHFSDVVLLNRREGVENKWLSGFIAHFKDKYYPCLFEMVKAGRVKNPALVLDPQPRRMTHVFEEEQAWIFTDGEGQEIDEQEESDDEDEIEAKQEEDPYFERLNGGRRVKQLPDIKKFLAQGA